MSYTVKVTNYACYLCGSVIQQETYPDGHVTNVNSVKVFRIPDSIDKEMRQTPICSRCIQLINEVTFQEVKDYKDYVRQKLAEQEKEIDKLRNILATLVDKPPKYKKKK
jgi:hypothetical protein